MTMSSEFKVRRTFVALSALALGVFILLQTWSAIRSKGSSARLRELMPVVQAEMIDQPMTRAQLDHRVEALPDPTGAVPTRTMAQVLDPRAADGSVVFLNFWATWCEPCVRELPSMIELAQKLRLKRFEIVAVSYDESWQEIARFFTRHMGGRPPELELLRDPATEEAQTLKAAFGTRKLPETYVIRDGRVLARFVNARDWTDPAMVEYFERLTRPAVVREPGAP